MILQITTNIPPPKRIVSLVPSITELLFYLDLEESIVGITKFCIRPKNQSLAKTKIGGTKNIDINKIKSLNPDLIIANKEENVEVQIKTLAEEFSILLTDVDDLAGALDMIKNIGQLTNRIAKSNNLINIIENTFRQILIPTNKINTAYLIWKNPYMTIGGDTYINDMLNHCGLHNIFSDKKRYPEVKIDEIKGLKCKLLLLSTEPFPFKQQHIEELKIELPNTLIILVDGEMFSWYGSRLLFAAKYFKDLASRINLIK